MQNIDFYDGKTQKNIPPQFERQDPEYFSRALNFNQNDDEKNKKKASRTIFFIIALCIISFTTGIVIGIKFAGGAEHEIIDEQTYNAVSGIGKKVTNIMNDQSNIKSKNTLFPIKEYPFVIKIGNQYDKLRSQEIANILSKEGYTVILSKQNDKYKIYTGPYKSYKTAKDTLQELINLNNSDIINNQIKVVKRI